MEKESREKQIYRVTIVGSIANFFLLVFKFVAGIFGQSSAMIADAVHSLSDFVTDIIVLVFVKVSAKPKDAGHDYGHGKYETLATAIIGIVLLMVGTGIFWNGLNQILAFYRGEELGSPDLIALVAALVSIVVKEILYRYSVIVGRRCKAKLSWRMLGIIVRMHSRLSVQLWGLPGRFFWGKTGGYLTRLQPL